MNRTQFHRQLAALYDAGNRQAIATQEIATRTNAAAGQNLDEVPGSPSPAAILVMAHTAALCAFAFAKVTEKSRGAAHMISRANEILQALRDPSQPIYAHVTAIEEALCPKARALDVQNQVRDPCALFRSLFADFEQTNDIEGQLKERVRGVLLFLLTVSRKLREAQGPVITQPPHTRPTGAEVVKRPKPMGKTSK